MTDKKSKDTGKTKQPKKESEPNLNDELDLFRGKYPHLHFELDELMIRVDGIKRLQFDKDREEKSISAWYYNTKHLSFILANTNGFQDIQLIENYKAMIIRNSIFASFNQSSMFKPIIDHDIKFLMNIEGKKYDVRISSTDLQAFQALTYVTDNMDFHNPAPYIKKSHDEFVKQLKETTPRKTKENDIISVRTDPIFESGEFNTLMHDAVLSSILGGFAYDEYQTANMRITISAQSQDRKVIQSKGTTVESDWNPIPSSCFYELGYIIIIPHQEEDNYLKNRPLEIIRSVFFDYYYHVKELLYVPRFDYYELTQDTEKEIILPSEVIFREINRMFEQYLITAESSQLPPFQFLSFYHIMEYLFEKVTHRKTAEDISSIVTRPDFLTKKEQYTARILRLAEERTSKGESELMKLHRVLSSILTDEFFEDFEKDHREHLEKKFELSGGHTLEPVIFPDSIHLSDQEIGKLKRMKKQERDAEEREKLLTSLSERIYNLRCAIVHSNPEFPGKHKPVRLDDKTLSVIEDEVKAIKRIAIELVSQVSIRGIA